MRQALPKERPKSLNPARTRGEELLMKNVRRLKSSLLVLHVSSCDVCSAHVSALASAVRSTTCVLIFHWPTRRSRSDSEMVTDADPFNAFIAHLGDYSSSSILTSILYGKIITIIPLHYSPLDFSIQYSEKADNHYNDYD